MKGKNIFSSANIIELKKLIILRNETPSSRQKVIRQKMRNIGFFGKDDWGITNLQIDDLNSLIKSGKIKIIDGNHKSLVTPQISLSNNTAKPNETKAIVINSIDIHSILNDFKAHQFDPEIDNELKVDNRQGNYILCLRKESNLPYTSIAPVYTNFEGLKVIYTGIASLSLRTRDFRQHFKGNNAGRSTLRKSLGVLFGHKQIPRDKDQSNGKTKFNISNEQELSEWMHQNLIMFTFPTIHYQEIEIMLINYFKPPLNLKANQNYINLDFRNSLTKLRITRDF